MNANSHPEPDERERLTAPPTQPDAATSLDPKRQKTLRERLLIARDQEQLSTNRLARRLGYSPSVVSQWLNGVYKGDSEKIERRIEDWLSNLSRRRLVGARLVPSEATRTVVSALEAIRQTEDVGVIFGDAGIGKTSAIEMYLAENPLAITVSLDRRHGTAIQIERLLAEVVDPGGRKADTTRWSRLLEALMGSGRFLIVDNCHRATRSGLELLFDLHDKTAIPIAMVGNEEVLRLIDQSDQMSSRIGISQPVTMTNPRALVRHLVAEIAPGFSGRVEDLAEQVADGPGRIRAAKKQLALSALIARRSSAPIAPDAAFAAAHLRLRRNYALA